MLVFIDFEHAEGHAKKHSKSLLAARTTITYRLEDLSGLHCHLVRYDRIDQALLDTVGASAIFISGNSTAPDRYRPDALATVHSLLRETTLPVFGFCGGFQLLAQAFGIELAPLDSLPDGTEDETVTTTEDGRPFEFGYHPIDLSPGAAEHPLMTGLGEHPVFRHAHGLRVPTLPAGFETLAATAVTPIQPGCTV